MKFWHTSLHISVSNAWWRSMNMAMRYGPFHVIRHSGTPCWGNHQILVTAPNIQATEPPNMWLYGDSQLNIFTSMVSRSESRIKMSAFGKKKKLQCLFCYVFSGSRNYQTAELNTFFLILIIGFKTMTPKATHPLHCSSHSFMVHHGFYFSSENQLLPCTLWGKFLPWQTSTYRAGNFGGQIDKLNRYYDRPPSSLPHLHDIKATCVNCLYLLPVFPYLSCKIWQHCSQPVNILLTV